MTTCNRAEYEPQLNLTSAENNAAEKKSKGVEVKHVSHQYNEAQVNIASHVKDEAHIVVASHPPPENHSVRASHDELENHGDHAMSNSGVTSTIVTPSIPRLRFLVETYYDIQKLRIMTGNRIERYSNLFKIDPKLLGSVGETHLDRYQLALEKAIVKELKQELPNYKIYAWLRIQKGIGPILSAGLISWIGDISRFSNISKLCAYAGQAPGQKRKRGEKSNWNTSLKTHCWKIGESFVKSKGYYREKYLEFKADDKRKHPEEVKDGAKTLYTKGHIHMRAKRKTTKLFLSLLWAKWRELEGLPVTNPYSEDILKHSGIDDPSKPEELIEKKKEPEIV